MKVFVYGTLKQGGGNDTWAFSGKNCSFEKVHTIRGYKLYNAGFPVAWPSPEDTIRGEIWEIGDPSNQGSMAEATLRQLDRLEGNGRMYNRTVVDTLDGEEISMYVGHPDYWRYQTMDECPIEDGAYEWGRERIARVLESRTQT